MIDEIEINIQVFKSGKLAIRIIADAGLQLTDDILSKYLNFNLIINAPPELYESKIDNMKIMNNNIYWELRRRAATDLRKRDVKGQRGVLFASYNENGKIYWEDKPGQCLIN